MGWSMCGGVEPGEVTDRARRVTVAAVFADDHHRARQGLRSLRPSGPPPMLSVVGCAGGSLLTVRGMPPPKDGVHLGQRR
jgi:hypothetical protein